MSVRMLRFLKLLLNIAVINAQSIRPKVCDLNDVITERQLDLLIITETWIKSTDGDYGMLINQLCPLGFNYLNKPRAGKKSGGGFGLVYRKSLNIHLRQNFVPTKNI